MMIVLCNDIVCRALALGLYTNFILPAVGVYFDERHFELYDSAVVTVTRSWVKHKHRRSTDVMPGRIDVTVTSRGSEIKLRLRRNTLANTNIPVFTLNQGNCIEQSTKDSLDWTRSGFYQDWDAGASLFVRNLDTYLEAFDMEGPLTVNGSSFLLTPSRDLLPMNTGGRAHLLKRIMTVMDFGHDFRDERSEEDVALRTARAEERRESRWQRTRYIRQSAVTHTVELTIVADYKIFEKFLRYTKGDREMALSEMKLYYIFMTNLMDIRYSSVTTIDPSLVIRIALVSLVVTDVREEAVWTERNKLSQDAVNAESALYSFREWLRVNTEIPRADHWMLFSGYDLAESSGTTATIGIAFIGTLCTDSAVSLVEEYFTATTGAVSAHELGHSIDADHDSMYQDCSDEDSHVMSTIATFPRERSRASNPWQFSSCSVDAFGAYLDSVQCALRPPPKSISSKEVSGLYLDADEQCKLAMGPGSYFCRTVQARLGYDLACRRLYCYLPDDPGFCASIVPQEYTSCNNNQWCQRGLCVYHQDAPSTIVNCPQGDDKEYKCQTANCSNAKVRDAYCCRTCAERRGVTISSDVTSFPNMVVKTQHPSLHTSRPGHVFKSSTMTSAVTATTSSSTPRPPFFGLATTTTISSSTSATIVNTDFPVASTPATECDDLECRCQHSWSVFCYFLMLG